MDKRHAANQIRELASLLNQPHLTDDIRAPAAILLAAAGSLQGLPGSSISLLNAIVPEVTRQRDELMRLTSAQNN